jgi:uncharacterized protein YkwD
MIKMRTFSCVLLAALTTAFLSAPAAASSRSSLEAAVLAEINEARVHPAAYADRLRLFRQYFSGRVAYIPGAGRGGLLTEEGVAAVDEAIAFMERQTPLVPLAESPVLDASAAAHAEDQGARGLVGHYGSDGSSPSDRIQAYGTWGGMVAENIAYGITIADVVVEQLIVDDNVPDRGHRKNIFMPQLRFAGVGCGPHRVYGGMCVIDFADSVMARGTPEPAVRPIAQAAGRNPVTRLQILGALLRQGLITQAEYNAKRQTILAGL